MKYQLRPAARKDLSSIWAYTADRWGIEQADHYVTLIIEKIENASNAPGIGSPIKGLRYSYRKLSVGSHRIYYRLSGNEMLVSRILHERMDINRELS
ncbi:type II toxin-antitoxin system RelE/ParE family toxin [Alterisphingorhabdus coralli]|uniref:type II toxin-antitoxin system RelE/ParE family toxin n=1 Tax=Alterisphingorhabdus coralli TaxID=3071408 RepID=UPI003872BF44